MTNMQKLAFLLDNGWKVGPNGGVVHPVIGLKAFTIQEAFELEKAVVDADYGKDGDLEPDLEDDDE